MMRFFLLGIAIIAVLLALLPHIIYLVVKLTGLIAHFRVSYRPFGIATLILVGMWVLTAIYGNIRGRFRHEVKAVELRLESLPPAFDGLRLVHISDLHLDGWVGHERELQQRVNEINALHPDIICFTGDLVSLSPDELRPFIPVLRQLRAHQGGRVYAVLGNHDYLPYNRSADSLARAAAVAELIRMEREELGWTVLLNESDIIHRGADSIAILGCENQSVGAHPVVQRGDLRKAMQCIAPDSLAMHHSQQSTFSILLTHDPSQWRKEVLTDTDIPLTLSGHTHAMQLRVLGFTPSRWIYPECDGLYSEGNQFLYVNIGLGGTLPWRIGATPEITLITLRQVSAR
ncbi:MAG: metallophosphoesterase [Bacteroidaceae bacterium]|nr:metallophosphoesterase [Bacteroidaceae bacterium]